MFKKLTVTTLLFFIIAMQFGSTIQAAPGSDLRIIPVIVNGYKVKFPDTEPYINTDGRTMVPVRFVSERLGADVDWEGKTRTISINYLEKEIRMTVDSREVIVNSEPVYLDTAAEMYEGRTMVPLRFVSEVLDSRVVWDKDSHSVRVTDLAYQAKIDSGEVELDPWGREYSQNENQYWLMLSDLEAAGFYSSYPLRSGNKAYATQERDWDLKTYADRWGEHIRAFYAIQLNVDYRNFNKEKFIEDSVRHLYLPGGYFEYQATETLREYADWVRQNKIVMKGYADPENSKVTYAGDGRIIVRTFFKFKIISAEDTSKAFLDAWVASQAPTFDKNVWYGVYVDVYLNTNYANNKHRHYKLAFMNNLFWIGSYLTHDEAQ